MELLSCFRTTKHITRQLNTQSLKPWHCHTGDFDDIYDENVRQKQSNGDMAASLNHFSNCVRLCDCDEQQWEPHRLLFVCKMIHRRSD